MDSMTGLMGMLIVVLAAMALAAAIGVWWARSSATAGLRETEAEFATRSAEWDKERTSWQAQERVGAAERAVWEADRSRLESRADLAEGSRRELQEQMRSSKQEADRERTAAQQERDRAANLAKLLTPLQDRVESLNRRYGEAEEARVAAQSELKEQVAQMGKQVRSSGHDAQQVFRAATKEVTEETRKLGRTLGRSEMRGSWGEMQLRRLVEASGMLDRVHFIEQDHQSTSDGVLRPDLIVKLEGDRQIVVDAKTPIDALLGAEGQTPEAQAVAAKNHARAVRGHVKDLSSKSYWKHYRSPEFVVLFLPAESLLSVALQEDPELLDFAFDRSVVLATPTTLMVMLQTVSFSWRQQQIAEETKQIRDLGVDLHQRFQKLSTHLSKLGRALSRAVEAYDETVSSVESRLLPGARKFGEMLQKEQPVELPGPIDDRPRQLNAARWDHELGAVEQAEVVADVRDPQNGPAAVDVRRSA